MTTCYLCGKEGADTTEHVVPRCVYPGKLPADVITLPAHGVCNKLTAKDEEAFRNHISVAMPPGTSGFPLWEATWRAIHRPQGAGMQRTFYEDMLSLPQRDSDGVVRASPVAAQLKYERANRVLAKMVRGLFTWTTKEVLPGDLLWRFGQAENGRDQVVLPKSFKVHDVLDVRWGRASNEPLVMLWILGFHGVVWFWAMTTPEGVPSPDGRDDGAPMLWPGP